MTPAPPQQSPRPKDSRWAESGRPQSRTRRMRSEISHPPVNTNDGAKKRPANAMLIYFTIAAVMLGLGMVYTASFPGSKNSWGELPSQALYAAIGIALMLIIGGIHPAIIRKYSLPLFIATSAATILTLLPLPFVHTSHGAALWLQVGSKTMQPSEFAKLAFILYISSQLAIGPLVASNFKKVGSRILAATGILAIILVAQGDQGMATLVVMIAMAMAFLGHLRAGHLAAITAFGLVLGTVFTLKAPYRVDRIKAFFDPLGDHLDTGWHILTMETTIAHGGLGGVGLGKCVEKSGNGLPEVTTDAVFCVIANEMGLIGSMLVLALLLALILSCMHIARRADDNTGYFMASGVGIMLALQALINLGAATHLLPITGLTLPLMSNGGSSLITCLVAIGVVLSVHRHPFPYPAGARK